LLEACLYKPPFAQNWNYNIVDCQYTQNVGKGSDGKPINYIIIFLLINCCCLWQIAYEYS